MTFPLASLSSESLGGARVVLDDVRRSFGDLSVLDGIDLTIEPGSFVAVIGQSGSGKSTLLKILAGLDDHFGGEVSVTTTKSASVTRIMYQEPRLLPWATVVGNVALGLGPHSEHRNALIHARQALDAVGLGDRAAEWPANLSGGQKQRVALARALVSHPDLLVLDEPLGALDALTRIGMQSLLETVWQREGFTALLVTHDVTEALTLADRIVVIEKGRIAFDIDVPFERPRRRGSVQFGLLEERLLDILLKSSSRAEDFVI